MRFRGRQSWTGSILNISAASSLREFSRETHTRLGLSVALKALVSRLAHVSAPEQHNQRKGITH